MVTPGIYVTDWRQRTLTLRLSPESYGNTAAGRSSDSFRSYAPSRRARDGGIKMRTS